MCGVLEPPLKLGAGGGSRNTLPGRVDRSSKRQFGARMPQSRRWTSRFGMVLGLSKRRGGPEAIEQGVLAPGTG